MSSIPLYNEETIITQITTFYYLLLRLSYCTSGCVNFPPEGAHNFNEELCHSLHLTPEVMSLMNPHPTTGTATRGLSWQSRAY
jgi:hypothetical protein